MNRLCETLGIRIPIIQAPTGSVAGPELASAVSKAGGLGSMGFSWTAQDTAVDHVRWIRGRTRAPFAVNFALRFEPSSLYAALEEGTPIITFSWGIPGKEAPLVRSFGAKFGIQVGNRDGARAAAGIEPDFIICQGMEAGGHVQSTLSIDDVLPAVIEECAPIPVVAAGGIADGLGIGRVMRVGAQGAMLGTRFVATIESRAHEVYKQRILQSESGETALTVCFDRGWTHALHRTLRNSTLEKWESYGCPPPGVRPDEEDVVGHTDDGTEILRYEDTAPRSGMTGNLEEMALYCGEGVGRILDLPPAGALLNSLWNDALDAGIVSDV